MEANVPGRPPAPLESALYFGIAECLANVGKHAQAAHAWVHLRHRDGILRAVVGDDGRGGADPGALGPGKVPEKQVNLGLALALQKALVAKKFNVVMTRSVDAEVYLAPRLALIDRYKADLFVSLHANSHVTPDSTGVETYWREGVSQPFAEAVQKQVSTLLNRPDRGVKQERLYVIRHPKVPSILLETGFISNPFEEILLADTDFQAQAARAIVSGIETFLSAPPTAAKVPQVQKEGRAGGPRGS